MTTMILGRFARTIRRYGHVFVTGLSVLCKFLRRWRELQELKVRIRLRSDSAAISFSILVQSHALHPIRS